MAVRINKSGDDNAIVKMGRRALFKITTGIFDAGNGPVIVSSYNTSYQWWSAIG
jgi:hypothetical protein